MIREMLDIYGKACEVLTIPEAHQIREAGKIREGLLPYRITEKGTIAEWAHDLEEADRQHRHTCHLLGLFPFAQITPETKELAKAAEETLRQKLNPPECWEDTGWARSMLILYEARLRNGDRAYAHLREMMEKLREPNNLIYHPPTRGAGAFDHVYELEGNTGLTSCIAEMLIQSHDGRIRLLPAVPTVWEKGKVQGFYARGGIRVSFRWKQGRVTDYTLESKIDQECRIKVNEIEETVVLKAGESFTRRFRRNHYQRETNVIS